MEPGGRTRKAEQASALLTLLAGVALVLIAVDMLRPAPRDTPPADGGEAC
jgi:hypothetical protein